MEKNTQVKVGSIKSTHRGGEIYFLPALRIAFCRATIIIEFSLSLPFSTELDFLSSSLHDSSAVNSALPLFSVHILSSTPRYPLPHRTSRPFKCHFSAPARRRPRQARQTPPATFPRTSPSTLPPRMAFRISASRLPANT